MNVTAVVYILVYLMTAAIQINKNLPTTLIHPSTLAGGWPSSLKTLSLDPLRGFIATRQK